MTDYLKDYDDFIAECRAGWELIQQMPLAELKWRAAVISDIINIDIDGQIPDVKTNMIAEGVEVFINDVDGDGWKWYFTRSGKSLLLALRHESCCNTFDLHLDENKNYHELLSNFDGVPSEMVSMAQIPAGIMEHSCYHVSSTGDMLQAVSGIFWHDGAGWHIADGTLRRHQETGEDVMVDLSLIIGDLSLGEELTVERCVELALPAVVNEIFRRREKP
ncbi:hypothetical protein QZN11_19810 [Streptomyces gramineus]|uniref:hypothetical protein n=1 Tax=Streptomyces gramineus TaxID=910542 RepID=UPI00398B4E3F